MIPEITYVHLSDVTRWVSVVGSYLLAAVIWRATYAGIRRYGWFTSRYPSPISGIALICFLVQGSIRRFDNLGTPGDGYLWAYLGTLVLFFIGTSMTLRLNYRLPWRRAGHPGHPEHPDQSERALGRRDEQ